MNTIIEKRVIVKKLDGQLSFSGELSSNPQAWDKLIQFGSSIYKIYLKNDPSYIYKLREATLKYLKRRGYDVYYRIKIIQGKKIFQLYNPQVGEEIEDIFLNQLTEAINTSDKIKNRRKIANDFESLADKVKSNVKKFFNSKIQYNEEIVKRKEDSYSLSRDTLLKTIIDRAIDNLSYQQKRAINLRQRGFKNSEIAEELNVNRSRVTQLLNSANKHINKHFYDKGINIKDHLS